jgi:hypothetical protein
MTIGIASFLAFRQSNYSTVVARYQSYWPDQIVDSHSFYPFNVSAIVSNATGGQESLNVDFATSATIIDLVEAGLANGYFVELSFYQFTPTASGAPPTAKTLFASYIGELISASQNETSISIQVGSSLNPVEAQAPPRKFTTTLIGEPPKI